MSYQWAMLELSLVDQRQATRTGLTRTAARCLFHEQDRVVCRTSWTGSILSAARVDPGRNGGLVPLQRGRNDRLMNRGNSARSVGNVPWG
mmetsp:Transcript_43973/g.64609  ORF Transcript_43973/g.64609 Transcript_43973/m.64609 type:complete len:90 (+) Transcript_43973:108-377(+)